MTRSVAEILAEVLANPLAQAQQSIRPLGYVGSDIPPDLALATGRVFCHLPWYSGRATPRADQWLESSFPGWTRSILQDWAEGNFDFFDAVIFSRGDDATQRLYYYVCELQRRGYIAGPKALMLDVATIPRPGSIRHCERALRTLLAELETDPAALRQGMEAANLRRRWYQSLLASRTVPGSLIENLTRAILHRDLFEVLGKLPFPALTTANTVLLAGSAPADDLLHRAAEAAGWNVCAELHPRALSRYGPPVDIPDINPVNALARRLNAQPYGVRSFGDRVRLLEQEIATARPRAVVLWLTEEDEGLAWDLARQRDLLQSMQVPHLILSRRRWDGQDGAVDDVLRFLGELSA